MSLNPTHGTDGKDEQASSCAVAVTGDAPTGDEEGACQDEVEVKGASTDGCDSLLIPQQKRTVGNEAVGAEFHPDSKSIKASAPQQKLVHIGSEDLSVLLPKEVVLMLFELMTPKDIVAASQTCCLWRILGENDKLWRYKCKEAGLAYILNSADLMKIQHRNEASTIVYSPWKANFLKPLKIEKRLRLGVPQVLTIERSHDVKHLQVFNDRIVCSNDTTLYVFSALSGDLLHELVGHTHRISSIQMDNQFVVSGSWDMSVKVWDMDTGSCVHTLLRHSGPVTGLVMQGNIAVSGSWDHTLRMWDVREGRCLRILSGHNSTVYNVQFDGNVVVSGSGGEVKIWDPETGECRRTMSHSSSIFSLKFNSVDVVAGYGDGSIKVWDVTTGVCRHTIEGNDLLPGVMDLQGDTLVCGGEDITTAKIWSLSTGAHLQTLAGAQKHRDWIIGIQLVGKLVVTSSRDGTLKLWDTTTGEFIRDLVVMESGIWLEMKIEDAKIVCNLIRDHPRRSKLYVFNFENNDEY